MNDTSGVDIGTLRALAGHGENVFLSGNLLSTVPAAQNLVLKK
jgi:hypothetical protein